MSITFYTKNEKLQDGPNFSNGNAYAVLSTLNLVENEDDIWDMSSMPIEIPTILRQCMAALSSSTNFNIRKSKTLNVVGEMQVYDNGIDKDGIIERIERLQAWLKEVSDMGEKEVYWG